MKTSKISTTKDYTIERVTEIHPYSDIAEFFYKLAAELDLYNLDFKNFDFYRYASENQVWVCRRKLKPVGVLFARLYPCVWDYKNLTLYQDGLFVAKSSGKAAYLLLSEFIDFGRKEANLVFTCRTKYTNVKEKSFERLGFKKAEELYLLGDV
jgi:hypothetical protein